MSATGEAGRPSRLGRYELITRIGQGGMAEVQLALQRGPAGFEKLVVVKLVHENLASQRAFVDMLLDEARVAALVKHPNVVDIYDLGEADGRYFIAMEYLEGEPLLAVLRAGRDGMRLDPLSTARLIADTAEGLDAAHELRSMAGDPLELVHHDISLGNIVVLYNGQVKLVDFGVAKATQSASTRTKVQGKFSYMAPEKMLGASGDRRSDIFSLGCVLWEALTLKRLYKGANDSETMKQVLEQPVIPPSQVNGDVSADFDPVVLRALARDPDQRYPTAKELAADLEEVLRKHGYAAKNDAIARHMQETFKSHIAARKKLLQEVSSKGSTTAETIEAAFDDSVNAPQPGPNEFSVKFRREQSSLPPPNRRKTEASIPPPIAGQASSSVASSAVSGQESSALLAIGTNGAVGSSTEGMPAAGAGLVGDARGSPAPLAGGTASSRLGSSAELQSSRLGSAAEQQRPDSRVELQPSRLGSTPAVHAGLESPLGAHPGGALPGSHAVIADSGPRTTPPPALRIGSSSSAAGTSPQLTDTGPRTITDSGPRESSDGSLAVGTLQGSDADPKRTSVALGTNESPPVDTPSSGAQPTSTAVASTIGLTADITRGTAQKRESQRALLYAIGGVTLVIVLLVVLFSSNSSSGRQLPAAASDVDHATPSTQPDPAKDPAPTGEPTTIESSAAQVVTPASLETSGSGSGNGNGGSNRDNGSSAAKAAADTATENGDSKSSTATKHHATKRTVVAARDKDTHPREKVDIDALLKTGLQAYVRGDAKAALDAFQRAKAASPGFAPAWRGLGMVYEKMGDAKAAKTAFQRYLVLAPAAADASSIRARMDALGS